MQLKKGDMVEIPVTYAKGAFADEFLVYINTDHTIMSGFARRSDLTFVDDTNARLRARILDVGDHVQLKVYGSFFTTNGIEPVQQEWAKRHLVAA